MSHCELCELEMGSLQFHHLIPKQLHSKKKYLRLYTKHFMRNNGINICKYCHKQIHWLFPHAYLGEYLNTVKALRTHPKFQKYLNWARKQKRYIV